MLRRAALAAADRDWLARHWSAALAGRDLGGLALAAVGSVGRGDAGPLSDYDLVLLHDGQRRSADLTALADLLWYPLWDSGIRLDHSVRTIAQCRSVAAQDLSAAIGLLDIAHVAGDRTLVDSTSQALAADWRSAARTRLPELLDKQADRHRRMGDLAQSLEPDLKEARGGLRDMTVLKALTRAWLTDRPHGEVDAAYALLLDVRDALHVVTGRGRERLTREEQPGVAGLLGHDDPDGLLTEVLGAGRTLAYAVDVTARRARQSQRARRLRVGPRRPQLRALGHGLHEHDGEIVLGPAAAPDALTPLRAALVGARSGMPIAPLTLQRLAVLPQIAEPWPREARELFTDLLAAGPGLVPVWEGLDLAGLVEQWIPPWVDVRSRPQRSHVHRHTVDRHLVEVTVEAAGLVRQVSRPDLLVLAALLHDIGKVEGADDHSSEGAERAAEVCHRLGLPPGDADVVITLVREHLTLMDLATRRDHDDPATISAVWDAVDDDPEVLDLLVALSEADARAAGPLAWTPWRARLLGDLVTAARRRHPERTLSGHLAPPVELGSPVNGVTVTEVADGWTVTVRAPDRRGLFADIAGVLALCGLDVRRARLSTHDGIAQDAWDVGSERAEAPDAARLAALLDRLTAGDDSALERLRRRADAPPRRAAGVAPRVLLAPEASDRATTLEVRADDRPGLLLDLARAFAAVGVDVRSAHIATSAGQAMDTFYVVERDGGPLAPSRVGPLVAALMEACDPGAAARHTG